ncbi:transcription termination factor Rho [Modestobacter sp. URMC 112]
MSDTTDLVDAASDATPSNEGAADAGAARSRRRGSGLAGMLLPELQRLAGELGIPGTARMRKSDLVAAISERQVGGASGAPAGAPAAPTTSVPAPRTDPARDRGPATSSAPPEAPVSGGGNAAPVTTPSAGTDAPTDGARLNGNAPDAPAAPTAAPAAETGGRRRRTASRPAGAPAGDAAAPAADAATAAPAAGTTTDPTPTGDTPAESVPAEGRTDGGRPPRTRGNRDRGERAAASEDRADTRETTTREVGSREDTTREDRRPDTGSGEERGGRNRGGDPESAERPERGRNRNERGNREDRPERNRDGGRNGNDNGRANGRADGRADGRGDDGNGRDNGNGRANGRGEDNGRADTGRNDRDGGRPDEDDDDFEGSGRRRGRRYRDRNRRGGNAPGGRERFEPTEPTVSEDDVLLPVAGILDVLDSYAFVRTSGYLTGPNDVYVSLSQVRRYGLRRGDAITGAVRQPREGERKDKYNALVRLDSVNGLDPEQARNRPEFTKLTPLYPQERLRLETEPNQLTTRLMDLVMPIGKGQRALIVSPPKAGKTMVLQAIANAITTNNPECHLMVVLVDERPEEVTDMQRSVKGEVIASTFDRPPSDHTTVAELSIERAKRLVEMGHDVVVLLDSITRLGRAYNLAAPASGRILSGGVDSTALYPPKRFLGAARNIENGGSLTIIASALVETGSTMDTVIFEEFKGTGNAEIKLDRRLADKRVFPAVDVNASGTRKEEILLAPDELAIVIKLRRVLSALEPQQAIELLLDRMRKTRNNIEFLMQVQKTTLGAGEKD